MTAGKKMDLEQEHDHVCPPSRLKLGMSRLFLVIPWNSLDQDSSEQDLHDPATTLSITFS